MDIKEPILQEFKEQLDTIKTAKKLSKKTPVVRITWKNKDDDKKWISIFVSENIENIWGYSPINFNFYKEIIHQDDIKTVLKEIEENKQKGIDSFEHQSYRIINKNGETRWVKDITTIIRDNDNNICHYQSLLIDITQQKTLLKDIIKTNEKYLALNKSYEKINKELVKQKEELENSKNKYRLLAENIEDVIWVYNFTKNKFEYISPSVFQLRGYTVEEALKLSFLDSLSSESKVKIEKEIPIRLHNFQKGIQRTYRDELEQIRKDKSTVWVEMITRLRYNSQNDIEIHGVSRNVTIRKKISQDTIKQNKKLAVLNQRLQESEKKYKLLSDLTFEGVLLHKNGFILDVNQSFLKIFGYTKEELINKNGIKLLIAPKYINKVKKYIQKQDNDYFEIEGIHKNGQSIPLELKAKFIVLNTKRIQVVAVRDLKQSKKRQQEIKKLSMAIHQSANSIIITDINGNIEYTNPKFSEITGYNRKEILGLNTRILKSGIIPSENYTEMWKTILSGEIWKGEFINKTKSGKYYYEKTTITPIKNDLGEIVNLLAIKEDITKQKKQEQELEDYKNILLYKTIGAEEKERRRIASDLHDGIAPSLSSLKLHLKAIENAPNTDVRKQIIQKSSDIIKESLINLKQIAKNLSPYLLEDFGLHSAIQNFIEEINIGTIDIEYHSNIQNMRFKTVLEISIFRIIKELINNSLKHSEAKNINVYIQYNQGNLSLKYIDNGKGFNIEEALYKQNNFLGLKNIKNRIESLKGILSMQSQKENGFYIDINIPAKKI